MFKGQTATSSGIGVSGRILSGVVQVGEKLRIVPGDETAVVRSEYLEAHQLAIQSLSIYAAIDQDNESVQWAAAGSHVTLFLGSVDPINLRYVHQLLHTIPSDAINLPFSIGYVLCPPSSLVPLATSFNAQVIIFDIQIPLTIGASVNNLMSYKYTPHCTLIGPC